MMKFLQIRFFIKILSLFLCNSCNHFYAEFLKVKKNKIYLKNLINRTFFIVLINFILISNYSFAKDFNHAISIFDDIKYKKDFKNFSYVNPDAKKSGHVKFGVEGSFNNLNQFILKGISANGLSYIYDTLTVASEDEISSRYGLVAKYIKLSSNKDSIDFILRKEARFHDGNPITSDDVIFTFDILTKKGHPSYKMAFRDIRDVIKINDYHLRFRFKHNKNRDLPILVASLPILPKHYYKNYDFDKTTLEAPLGSGPYKIKDVKLNRSITYERVKDYWAKDLPVNKGRYNFDQITFDYYRDPTVLVEAFKAQKYDFRLENVARNWSNLYDIDAIKNGDIIKQEILHKLPAPMQSFVINLRKEKFQNIALRQALNLAFDFEWLKKHIFYNSYQRTNSYFANTEFSFISSLGQNDIKKFDFLTQNSHSDGFNRNNLIKAQQILEDAGYKMINQKLIDPKNNKQISIEILNQSQSFTMIIAPFIKNLKKLGINAKSRIVEENQYKTRVNNFDFDIIVGLYGQSLIPGNEIYSYFHSSQKNIKGSRNLGGIDNKKIDKMIESITQVNNIEDLKDICQKLDKTLLENYYVIPQWYSNSFRILYRNIFAFPKNKPQYSLAIDSWYLK